MTPTNMDPETHRLLVVLDERIRRLQLDVSYIKARFAALQLKVATLAGIVATIVAVILK